MKIKVLTFPDGKQAFVQEGEKYSTGANVEDTVTLQINKKDPLKEEKAHVPEDFFDNTHKYEFKREKRGRGERVLRIQEKADLLKDKKEVIMK